MRASAGSELFRSSQELVWVQPLYQYLVIPNTLRGTNRGDGTNRADSESPFLVSELGPDVAKTILLKNPCEKEHFHH
jgi:hypothetical protein